MTDAVCLVPQRKHEGLERDLAALEDKVMVLGQEATRLCGIHDDHQDQIKSKNAEILDSWKDLTAKAQVRRAGDKAVRLGVIFSFVANRRYN